LTTVYVHVTAEPGVVMVVAEELTLRSIRPSGDAACSTGAALATRGDRWAEDEHHEGDEPGE